ncbi:MAG TPA: DUF1631 family protein, partial [Gammaproteobacteria bacterium]|nr:DUF1631 family protein [Gammaproteobacteria bacterium]
MDQLEQPQAHVRWRYQSVDIVDQARDGFLAGQRFGGGVCIAHGRNPRFSLPTLTAVCGHSAARVPSPLRHLSHPGKYGCGITVHEPKQSSDSATASGSTAMSHSAPKNVVNLGDFDQLRKGAGYGAGARVLKECRDIAARRLEQHIARMMEKVDDALFSRAEKAESNSIQTRYFDAMREMRIIRKDIEESFIEEFRKRFDAGTPRQAGSSEALSLDWESGGDSDLSLVESDDLEEDLAVTNMVNKLRGTCTQSMYALDRRIGLLIRDPELERWFNPLGPECICNAFKTATKHIETGIEIRLVVLKLFDQHVVNQIDALYKEINQHLVSRGVMPEVRATVRRNPNGPAAGGYAGGGAAPVDGA